MQDSNGIEVEIIRALIQLVIVLVGILIGGKARFLKSKDKEKEKDE